MSQLYSILHKESPKLTTRSSSSRKEGLACWNDDTFHLGSGALLVLPEEFIWLTCVMGMYFYLRSRDPTLHFAVNCRIGKEKHACPSGMCHLTTTRRCECLSNLSVPHLKALHVGPVKRRGPPSGSSPGPEIPIELRRGTSLQPCISSGRLNAS